MTSPSDDSAGDDFGVVLPARPYPGLRPFQKPEWPIFFGRETMTDDVIARLIAQKFVVVHGDSGCGKSSLLRAGVFARLEQENARGGLTWRTCATEPGDAPLLGLARQLAKLDGRPDDEARTLDVRRLLNFEDAPDKLAAMLLRGQTDHLCILVDQFEELFAFARNHGKEEAGLLIALLIGLLEKPRRGLYAVVAMRSEFLGACAQFAGFAEAVNRAQYLLPRMVHTDLVRAIREPATLYEGQISRELADRLIVDAGGGQDQLPLIQHGLMVLSRSKSEALEGRDSSDAPPWRLDLQDYDVNVSQLLSDHADALCPKSGDPGERAIERVFRALTMINADGQAIRRPQTFAELLRVTGTNERVLDGLLKPFRAEGASLLRPYGDTPLESDSRVDISHEALIRCWKRIADPTTGWLRREFQDGLIWQSLLVQSESFERDPTSILSPATAKEREGWLAEQNEAWADRYKGGWPGVQRLVRASVGAARAAEAAKRRRVRQLIASCVIAAVVFFAISIGLLFALQRANQETATSLWNRLDFVNETLTDDELHALQEIVLADRFVRRAFIGKIQSDPAKLGRRSASVLRAVYLKWPASDASGTWDAVLQALANERRPNQVRALIAVATATPGRLSAQQALAAVEVSVKAFGKVAPSEQLDYATLISDVTRRLSADQAPPVLEALLKALPTATHAIAIEGLGRAIAALPVTLPEEQTASAFGAFLKALARESDDAAALAIGRGMHAVASKLPPGESSRLAPIVTALTQTTDPSHLRALAVAVRDAPGGLAADQRQTVLATQLNVLTTKRPRSGAPSRNTSNPQVSDVERARILAAAEIVDAVPGPLGDDQARTVFGGLLTSITGSTDVPFDIACTVIQQVGRRQTAEQASSVRRPVMSALAATAAPARTTNGERNLSRLRCLTVALRALPGQASDEDARSTRARLLSALPSVTSFDLAALASAIAAVPAPLPADQADKLTSALVKALAGTNDRNDIEALAWAISEVADKLPPVQAESALDAVVSALSRTEWDTDPLKALAAAVRSLPGHLTAQQGQVGLAPLVGALVRTRTNVFNDEQMTALSAAVQAIIAKLGNDDASRAAEPLIQSLRTATDASQLNAVLLALAGVAEKLDHTQVTLLREAASSLLAWSPKGALSVTAARALGSPALRAGAGEPENVKRIVEFLKYPTAGDPTDVLLETLRAIQPGAPGKDAGLDVNLEWIARTYPSLDLDHAPRLPGVRTVTVQNSGSRGGYQ